MEVSQAVNNGEPWWIGLIKAVIFVNVLLISMAFLTLYERKLLARMQRRLGPNRAGPKGLLQPFADLIKMVRKEAFAPVAAIDTLYLLAPAFAAFTALTAFSVIPWGEGWDYLALPRERGDRRRADLPDPDLRARLAGDLRVHHRRLGVRVEVLVARVDADVCADGLVRGRALRAVRARRRADGAHAVALPGSSKAQVEGLAGYAAPQFVGLVIFFIAGVAETNRPPFDLPEADTELVGGYSTEYSGMRWGLFQMAEYVNVIVLSALAVTNKTTNEGARRQGQVRIAVHLDGGRPVHDRHRARRRARTRTFASSSGSGADEGSWVFGTQRARRPRRRARLDVLGFGSGNGKIFLETRPSTARARSGKVTGAYAPAAASTSTTTPAGARRSPTCKSDLAFRGLLTGRSRRCGAG